MSRHYTRPPQIAQFETYTQNIDPEHPLSPLIFGNRAFLVGRSACGPRLQLWRLAKISTAAVTEERFNRDAAFDLQRFARRSFGTCVEPSVAVVLRFAARVTEDVAEFIFHPDQTVERGRNGHSPALNRTIDTEISLDTVAHMLDSGSEYHP